MQHRRKIYGIVLLLVALCFAASLVSAQNGQGHGHGKGPKHKHFSARGEVLAIDPVALTMTVQLQQANRILKTDVGSPVDFKVNPDVRVKSEGADPCVFDLAIEDVDVGDIVRILGWFNGTDFVVNQIVILQD
jgi:hypothetical protein